VQILDSSTPLEKFRKNTTLPQAMGRRQVVRLWFLVPASGVLATSFAKANSLEGFGIFALLSANPRFLHSS